MIIHSKNRKKELAETTTERTAKNMKHSRINPLVTSGDLSLCLLTLVNSFELNENIAIFENKHEIVKNFSVKSPEGGIILSTSGSKGERRWIFHPWSNLKGRIHSLPAPLYSSATFLSLAHAAGVEIFFRHYLYNVDIGFYSPASSPADALLFLEAQKAQALSTTPSTFLRFISYPRLREWIKENLKSISLGGEEISDELLIILEQEFSHIQVQSIFGTTETWSVKTQKGQNLQWHIPVDEQVTLSSESGKLCILTPYLFSHIWDGSEFVKRAEHKWITGDETNQGNEYRFKRSSFKKYHGLKIYPDEWERFFKETYKLSWIQIKERENNSEEHPSFVAILPDYAQELLPEIKKVVRENGWPIFMWVLQAGPETTSRGKLDTSITPLISANELKETLSKRSRKPKEYSFLEPNSWYDAAQFHIFENPNALVFYSDYPCRRVIQYLTDDEAALKLGLKEIKQGAIIKLPLHMDLTSVGWKDVGCYSVWDLNFNSWQVPLGSKFSWGDYYPLLSTEFDRFLTGSEKIILNTLSDCMGFYGKDKDGEGLCAFSFIDESYSGMYMVNQGLSFMRFFQLCVQGLLLAKSKQLKHAKTVVHMQNKGAEFIHHALGFTKRDLSYRVWSNKQL